MSSTQQLSFGLNELKQYEGGENKIEEEKPDEDEYTKLDSDILKRMELDNPFPEFHYGPSLDERENWKKKLKAHGYDLSLTCGYCENPFEGEDVKITKHFADGSENYHAIPLHCPECIALFAKESRQTRRGEIICFFAEDKYYPKCTICGDDYYDKLELDHVAGDGKKERLERKYKPRRKGWEWDHEGEFQVLCKTCNRRKSDLTLETIIPIYKNLLKHSKNKSKQSSKNRSDDP